jgi:hypothetical protein
MDEGLLGYIRANRDRYTREAITSQLVAAGHDRASIDAAWEQVATARPAGGSEGRNLGNYVWAIYWLGAGIIAAITVISMLGSGGGPGFIGFGIGWLVAYLFLAYWPARAFARARPMGAGGMLAVVVGVPLVVVLIGGGICLGTVLVIVSTMQL